jgi:hypothetical protein
MSLLPLGLLSQGGGAAAGAFELIQTANGTGSSGIIDFTSIPATYQHLQIRYTAKNTSALANMNITFNGVTSANYARHSVSANSNAIAAASATSANNISLLNAITASTIANTATGGVIDILDYATANKNRVLRAMYGVVDTSSTTSFMYLASGFLNATTAVSSITLTASANNFATMSRFSLYGIKGSLCQQEFQPGQL